MTTEIRIYVEGGGHSRHIQGPLRLGFDAFFSSIKEKACEQKIRFQVVMSGSCEDTCRDYLLALEKHRDAVNVLLVDSEGPVAKGISNGEYLRQRGWKIPKPFDPRCHLMVQAMEVLFVADADALGELYRQHFLPSALPTHANLEAVTVKQLTDGLKNATKHTTAGEYQKIQHAAKLLPKLDVDRVRTMLPHCNQLFIFLESLL